MHGILFKYLKAHVEEQYGAEEWTAAMDAADIGHLRIDRRMDMGIRLTIVDINGRLHRLPPELHAPAEALATALDQAGIAHERHPFSLIPG